MEWLEKLSDSLTVDQIAALTDADMVRRRFDSWNIRWIGAVSVFAFLAAFSQMIRALFADVQPHLVPIGLAHFVVALVGVVFFAEAAYAQRRRGAWKPHVPVHLLARNFTPWVMAFLIAELTFLTFFRGVNRDDWLVWGMTFPWVFAMTRLDVSRRLTLHVSLFVVLVLNTLLLGTRQQYPTHEYSAVVALNTVAFLIGAAMSRRAKRLAVEEWTDRRMHAREQLRMRDELEYAREVQLSMLPERSPDLEWLDIAATSAPATEVGGDYYDYFVDGDSIAIVSGDVAGHGLASGIVLASLRSGFTLLRDALDDPASVLQRLNDLVAQTSRRRMLATAAVVRIDRATQRAVVASAGHPPVLMRRNQTVEAIELFAPPLGVRLPYRVPSREISFGKGDVFLLHSDGVYESQNAAGESYGLERLARLLSSAGATTASAIRDAIVRDVETFRAGARQEDDITVVVARVL